MTTSLRSDGVRTALAILALALLLTALAGCGKIRQMVGIAPPRQGATDRSNTSAPSAKAVDYASLVSVDDVARITGVSSVTTMPPGMRSGDSPYYVLFTSPTTPEFVSFRAGKAEMYDEQLKLLKGTETKLTVGDKEAYSYSNEEMAESGVVVRMPDSTYMVVARWLFKTPEGKAQITDEQLKQIAGLAVQRSE